MKILVAAACVAIIAFVGFFFWDRHSEGQRMSLAAECTLLRDRIQATPNFYDGEYDRAAVDRCFNHFLANPPSDSVTR